MYTWLITAQNINKTILLFHLFIFLEFHIYSFTRIETKTAYLYVVNSLRCIFVNHRSCHRIISTNITLSSAYAPASSSLLATQIQRQQSGKRHVHKHRVEAPLSQNNNSQEIVHCLNRVMPWHSLFLRHLWTNARFVLYLHIISFWIYCFVTWCCATNASRILCDSLLFVVIGFCCNQSLSLGSSLFTCENILVPLKSFWESELWLATEWNDAIECIIKHDNGFEERSGYPTTFGVIIMIQRLLLFIVYTQCVIFKRF